MAQLAKSSQKCPAQQCHDSCTSKLRYAVFCHLRCLRPFKYIFLFILQNIRNPSICHIYIMHVSIHYVLDKIRIIYHDWDFQKRLCHHKRPCQQNLQLPPCSNSKSGLAFLRINHMSCDMWQASVSSSCSKENKIKQSRKPRAMAI